MITRNMGRMDRVLRLLVGLVLIPIGLAGLGGLQGDWIGTAVAVAALLPLATSLSGFCPLYVPFGVSTLRRERSSPAA